MMMQSKIRILGICMVLVLAAVWLGADDQIRPITFSGTFSRAVTRGDDRSVFLSGNAWIETGSARIEAEEITISGENYRFAVCSGSVFILDTDQDITLRTSLLEYDRFTSTAVSRGWTEMEDRSNALIARGGYLENSGETGITLIQIAARILKDTDEGEMLCRTDSARYDSKAQILELTGNSVVYWNQDVYRASKIIIDLDTNEITLEGNVTGTIYE